MTLVRPAGAIAQLLDPAFEGLQRQAVLAQRANDGADVRAGRLGLREGPQLWLLLPPPGLLGLTLHGDSPGRNWQTRYAQARTPVKSLTLLTRQA